MAIRYKCLDGSTVTEATIRSKYSKSLKEKHSGQTVFVCEGCGSKAEHNDHSISQKRCKQIGKTELIWDQLNYVSSCHRCHNDWEGYKSGDWISHMNMENRLKYVKLYDPEGYKLRIELTKLHLDGNR